MHIDVRSAVAGALVGGLLGVIGGLISAEKPPFWLEPWINEEVDVAGKWHSAASYEQLFFEQKLKSLYPVNVQAKIIDGSEMYRADWRAFHAYPFNYESYSNMSRKDFDLKNSCLQKLGYQLSSSSQFKKVSGKTAFLATWICIENNCYNNNNHC